MAESLEHLLSPSEYFFEYDAVLYKGPSMGIVGADFH